MVFKRCRWFKQNMLWFLCGVCTVIWILDFTLPHRNQQQQRKHHDVFQEGFSGDMDVLEKAMASRELAVIQQRDGKWVEDCDVCKTNETFPHATLHTPTGDVDIHIYPPEYDVWISGFIDKDGKWEPDLVSVIVKLLQEHPDWVFIDVGANIGVYTISVAKAGFNVVAIEPLTSNVQRLCRSVRKGKFNGTVRIIQNAVSDSNRKVALGRIQFNVGGTYIDDKTESIDPRKREQTITLDDLVSVFRDKTVVMKMDVENHESKVLMGAVSFFKHVDVKFLLMEFQLGRHQVSSARLVTKFLQDRHMIPVNPTELSKVLDARYIEDWPTDVMWVKLYLTK